MASAAAVRLRSGQRDSGLAGPSKLAAIRSFINAARARWRVDQQRNHQHQRENADFNGVVNFDDYSRIDSGFLINRTGWLNGDFDGNGIVNLDDYSLIDLAFNTQGETLRPQSAPALNARDS